MRKTVLLDCDGVLADFASAFVSLINDHLGTAHEISAVDRFNVCEALGLSVEEGSAVRRRLGQTVGFARRLQPYPDARAAVAELREIADVYVVTSPWNSHPTWMHDREYWLKRHFDIPHSNVIHTSAKYLVHGDMFVDDKIEAVEMWRARWRDGVAVHWQTPHNVAEQFQGLRTNSWEMLVGLVRAGSQR